MLQIAVHHAYGHPARRIDACDDGAGEASLIALTSLDHAPTRIADGCGPEGRPCHIVIAVINDHHLVVHAAQGGVELALERFHVAGLVPRRNDDGDADRLSPTWPACP